MVSDKLLKNFLASLSDFYIFLFFVEYCLTVCSFWNPALKRAFLKRTTGLWDESVYDEESEVTGRVRVEFVDSGAKTQIE